MLLSPSHALKTIVILNTEASFKIFNPMYFHLTAHDSIVHEDNQHFIF